MLRALGLAMALAVIGCGDDSTTGSSMDLSQPVLDLTHPAALMCGISTCTGDCSGCLSFGGGVCVPTCKTSMPSSCTAPASCHALAGGDPDAGGPATLVGSCAGFDGYCG